ncbi:hypothetical protein SOVF_187620, partial [Spinacia oleracea]
LPILSPPFSSPAATTAPPPSPTLPSSSSPLLQFVGFILFYFIFSSLAIQRAIFIPQF